MGRPARDTSTPSGPRDCFQGWAWGVGKGTQWRRLLGWVCQAAQDYSCFSPASRQEFRFKHRKAGPAHISSATSREPHQKVTGQDSLQRVFISICSPPAPVPPPPAPRKGARPRPLRLRGLRRQRGPKTALPGTPLFQVRAQAPGMGKGGTCSWGAEAVRTEGRDPPQEGRRTPRACRSAGCTHWGGTGLWPVTGPREACG